jgi:MFS family permease
MGVGPKRALVAGLALGGLGLLVFARSPVDGSYVTDILPVMVLLGTGAGLCFPALMTLAMSGATQSDAGLASGLVNTTVQVGGAIGLAVLATLATERTDSLRAGGEAVDSALNSGYHLAYLIGGGLMALAIVTALVVVRSDDAVGAEQPESPEGEPAAAEPAYSEAA